MGREAALGIRVRRWTQRTLLYPLAIFAIIAPTVVLGLFGAYALREIELRPASDRQELRTVQESLQAELDRHLARLTIEPPTGHEDLPRVANEVDDYLGDFRHSIASVCLIGLGGKVAETRSDSAFTPSAGELEAITEFKERQPQGGAYISGVIALPREGGARENVWVVHYRLGADSFVAWRLLSAEVERLVNAHLKSVDFKNNVLSVQLVEREGVVLRGSQATGVETLGFMPVPRNVLPSRYIALRGEAGNPFLKDDTLLSSLFIVIAVLCVPIVASATLMAVHMILREASEARKKVDFVSNVTHELKTPLTSIRMFVETLVLGRAKDDAQRQACLEVIMSETERLGALIDHVLSFSKVENQVKKYNMQPNNIAQVVRDTVSLFKAQMANVQGEVRLKMLPGLPNLAVFDKDALREVLLNLLSNSIKYGGAEKFVTVQVGMDHNDLFIEVADRGIGIPQEDLARIFDKFYRVDQELSRNVDGTGLGLAICKEIVSAHGGRIVVSSILRKGSTFTVYIPYRVPKAGQKRTTATHISPSRRDTQTVAGEPV